MPLVSPLVRGAVVVGCAERPALMRALPRPSRWLLRCHVALAVSSQLVRLTIEAPGWAGVFCAPREIVVERMCKVDEVSTIWLGRSQRTHAHSLPVRVSFSRRGRDASSLRATLASLACRSRACMRAQSRCFVVMFNSSDDVALRSRAYQAKPAGGAGGDNLQTREVR